MTTGPRRLCWTEDGYEHAAVWRSESMTDPPEHVVVADDRMTADEAYRLARAGTGILWRGDFQNARQLLAAMGRRAGRDAPGGPGKSGGPRTSGGAGKSGGRRRAGRRQSSRKPQNALEAFRQQRREQALRAERLGTLLVPFTEGHAIPLRRAPDVHQACTEAYGPATDPAVGSLRELLGVIGAHEWRVNGVEVPALGARIHPHYGVFAPVRNEYVDLVARAPIPDPALAFDVGTGTGVLAAVLANRGVARVVATDREPRALECARDNVTRLGLAGQVEVHQADLFPHGRAPLVVCNPPWIPAEPSSRLEQAIYDPDGRMLWAFLDGLADHLRPGGEGWLVLSDFAEHLGLRSRADLLAAIDAGGLRVLGREETTPRHPRAFDPDDPLHQARAAEVTSLWRLAPR